MESKEIETESLLTKLFEDENTMQVIYRLASDSFEAEYGKNMSKYQQQYARRKAKEWSEAFVDKIISGYVGDISGIIDIGDGIDEILNGRHSLMFAILYMGLIDNIIPSLAKELGISLTKKEEQVVLGRPKYGEKEIYKGQFALLQEIRKKIKEQPLEAKLIEEADIFIRSKLVPLYDAPRDKEEGHGGNVSIRNLIARGQLLTSSPDIGKLLNLKMTVLGLIDIYSKIVPRIQKNDG